MTGGRQLAASESGSEGVSQKTGVSAEDVASFIVEILEDKRAEDIVWLDVSEVTDLAQYFIVATANNPRQMGAIADALHFSNKV